MEPWSQMKSRANRPAKIRVLKRRRAADRAPLSRNQGNTSAGRRRARKMAGLARARQG